MSNDVAATIAANAAETLRRASAAELAAIESDLRVYGVVYYRINLAGALERLEPSKVQIRQPWDRPRHS